MSEIKYSESEMSKKICKLNLDYLKLKNSKEYRIGAKITKVRKDVASLNFSDLFDTAKMHLTALNRKKISSKSDYRYNSVCEESSEYSIKKNLKIAVYTCIVGRYDDILEPFFISDYCDYFIITDQEIPRHSVWKKIETRKLSLNNYSSNEINRYVKLHPHILFPEYDFSLYVDGNIRVMTDVVPIVAQMNDKIIGLHRHNKRDCIYEEAMVIMKKKRFAKIKTQVDEQVKCYNSVGFPKHKGLFENPILFRKHNDFTCIKIMEEWWNEMRVHAMRDQISLPFVFWKLGINESQILLLGDDLRMNPRFRKYDHLPNEKKRNKYND